LFRQVILAETVASEALGA